MVARGLKVSSRTVHREIERGKLPARTTEEGWKKIAADDLDEYIANQKKGVRP